MHVCVYVCVWLSAKMAHLLTCSVKMAHLWTDSCILCCMRVYLHACMCVCTCVWLSAKITHLSACSVKMAHLWTDGCILCCIRGNLYACESVYICVWFFVWIFSMLCQDATFLDRQPHLVLSYWGEPRRAPHLWYCCAKSS